MKQKKPMNALRGLKLFIKPSDTFCNRDNGIIAIVLKIKTLIQLIQTESLLPMIILFDFLVIWLY